MAVGTAARALYWMLATPDWTPVSDADHYLEIARNLASGSGYSLIFPQVELHATAFRPPLYPILLAVPNWLLGQDVLWPSRLLSVLLGAAVVGSVVVLVGRIAGTRSAIISGLATALYPPLLANDTVTLSEPLALLLLLGILIAIERRQPVACGILTGLLLLTRPNAYLVAVVAGVALWRYLGPRRVAPFVLAVVAIAVPWSIRDYVQVGTPRLTTSEGFNLAAIYAPEAQLRGLFVDPVFSDAYDGSDLKIAQFDEAVWNDRLTSYALHALAEHPDYLRYVIGQNVLSYFELQPGTNDIPERLDGRNMAFRAGTLPIFYAVTALGLAGLVINWRRPSLWPAMFIVAQFSVLSLVLVAPPRLRAPFDLLMCIGLGLLFSRSARKRRTGEAASPSSCPKGTVRESPAGVNVVG